MTTNKKEYKKVKLQYHSNRYTVTVPEWMVRKVLCATKGDTIIFDFEGDKLTLKKEVKNYD